MAFEWSDVSVELGILILDVSDLYSHAYHYEYFNDVRDTTDKLLDKTIPSLAATFRSVLTDRRTASYFNLKDLSHYQTDLTSRLERLNKALTSCVKKAEGDYPKLAFNASAPLNSVMSKFFVLGRDFKQANANLLNVNSDDGETQASIRLFEQAIVLLSYLSENLRLMLDGMQTLLSKISEVESFDPWANPPIG